MLNWTTYPQDVLPYILENLDNHVKIMMLDLKLRDYHSKNSFRPYTKKSLLIQILALLKKTKKLFEYQKKSSMLFKEISHFKNRQNEQYLGIDNEQIKEAFEKIYNEIQIEKDEIISTYINSSRSLKREQRAIKCILEETNDQVNLLTTKVSRAQWLTKTDNQISIRNFKIRKNLANLYKFSLKIFQVGKYEFAEFFIVLYLQYYSNVLNSLENKRSLLKMFIQKHKKKYQKACWGRLCCRIILSKDSTSIISEMINNWEQETKKKYLEIAKNRCWILHGVLIHCLINERDSQGTIKILQWFNEECYMNTILMLCPWLCRYLVLAVICSQQNLGQKVIQCEIIGSYLKKYSCIYKDSLTVFLYSLFNDCNFEDASKSLQECRNVFTIDMLLSSYSQTFFNQSRFLFFTKFVQTNIEISLEKIGFLLMLDQYGQFEDDHTWWIVKQSVNNEPRDLNQWIIDAVHNLQKEKSFQQNEERCSKSNLLMQIDLTKKILIATPRHTAIIKKQIEYAKVQYFEAKEFYELLY